MNWLDPELVTISQAIMMNWLDPELVTISQAIMMNWPDYDLVTISQAIMLNWLDPELVTISQAIMMNWPDYDLVTISQAIMMNWLDPELPTSLKYHSTRKYFLSRNSFCVIICNKQLYWLWPHCGKPQKVCWSLTREWWWSHYYYNANFKQLSISWILKVYWSKLSISGWHQISIKTSHFTIHLTLRSKSLLKDTSKKISKLHITGPLWGESNSDKKTPKPPHYQNWNR